MVFPSAHRSWLRASPADRALRGQGAVPKPRGASARELMQNATHFAPGLSLFLGTMALPVCGIWQDDISPWQRARSRDSGEHSGTGSQAQGCDSPQHQAGAAPVPPLTHQQPHVEVVALCQQLCSVLADHSLHLGAAQGQQDERGRQEDSRSQPNVSCAVSTGSQAPLTASSICSGVMQTPTPQARSKSATSRGSKGWLLTYSRAAGDRAGVKSGASRAGAAQGPGPHGTAELQVGEDLPASDVADEEAEVFWVLEAGGRVVQKCPGGLVQRGA